MKKREDVVLKIIGGVFFIFGAIAAILAIANGKPDNLFWFCYLGLILLGIGSFFKSSTLVVSQMNILLTPAALWSVDFVYLLTTGKELWGLTNYFFESTSVLENVISSQHLFVIPVAAVVVYLLGRVPIFAWAVSFIQMVVFFFVGRAVLPMESEVNCFFTSCMPFELPGNYMYWWLGIALAMVIGTNVLLWAVLDKRVQNK